MGIQLKYYFKIVIMNLYKTHKKNKKKLDKNSNTWILWLNKDIIQSMNSDKLGFNKIDNNLNR